MFKPGDRVVCINDTGTDLENKQTYTIDRLDKIGREEYVYLKEVPTAGLIGFFPERFKLVEEEKEETTPKAASTQEKINILFTNFKEFLKEKNRRYGDSALNPLNIFSKEPADNELCNRLDDKLSRIKVSKELRKNDVADVFGYIALLLISKGWTSFEDLLD